MSKTHNIHFGMGGALMSGAGEEGLKLADAFMDVFAEIPESNLWRQFTANNAYAIYGRFGTPEQVAALEEPPESQPLLRISRHYARGEAAARAGDPASVREEAQAIAAIRAATTFAGPMAENQDGFTEISQRILEGRAAMLEQNWEAARIAYGRAAEIHGQGEEGGDPPVDWPNDPYSYWLLAQAERALGDEEAAGVVLQRSRVEWVGGEMSLALA